MIVPFLLFLASVAAFAAALLAPGYDPLILLALPCILASLILLATAWVRRKPGPPHNDRLRGARQGSAVGRRTDDGARKPAGVFRKPGQRRPPHRPVLVDGSNVLHWKDNAPQIASVRQVVDLLRAQGFSPGVVFDATVGYKIGTRYRDDAEMAAHLGLPVDRVLVVPKGTQADPVLLATARDLGAPIVTNDRFRDWAEAHPEVQQSGHLIRGGYADGKLWLDPVDPAQADQGKV